MFRRRQCLVVFAAILGMSLAGCTTQLSVSKLGPSIAPEGMVYFLPYMKIDMEHRRALTECGPKPSADWMAEWIRTEINTSIEPTRKRLLPKTGLKFEENEAGFKSALGDEMFAYAKPLLERHVARKDGKVLLSKEALQALVCDLADQSLKQGSKGFEGLWPENFGTLLGGECSAQKLQVLLGTVQNIDTPTNATIAIEVAHSVDATPRFVQDHDNAYVVQYSNLSDRNKKTDLNVKTYPNGTLKSVNATLTDRTAQVISGFLRGALQLAAASQGVPVSFASASEPESGKPIPAPMAFEPWFREKTKDQEVCQDAILLLLDQRRALIAEVNPTSKRIRELNQKIEKGLKTLDELKTKLAAAKAAVAKLVEDGAKDSDTNLQKAKQAVEELQKSINQQEEENAKAKSDKEALEKEISGKQARLASVDKKLTVTTVWELDPSRDNPQKAVLGADKARKAWFEEAALCSYCKDTKCAADKNPVQLLAWTAIDLAPRITADLSDASAAQESGSLVYRQPAQGRLLVCREQPCLTQDTATKVWKRSVENQYIVASSAVEVPQMGVLATLPLVNKTFQNQTLVVTFAESGSLLELQYTSNARLEAAAQAFEGSAGDLATFLAAQRDADKLALERETAEVEAEKSKIEAELALEQARRCLEAFRQGEQVEGCGGGGEE